MNSDNRPVAATLLTGSARSIAKIPRLETRLSPRHCFRNYGIGSIILVLLGIYVSNASWLAPERSGRPFLLAHRGLGQPYDRVGLTGQSCTAARSLPSDHAYLENTLPSIRAAFELGASIVEFDVQPTVDGHFVLFHDATLDCRTGFTGRTRDYRLEDLQRLDIGYGYTVDGGQSWPFRGHGVGLMPTLATVLESFPAGSFLIDIKGGTVDEARRLGKRIRQLQEDRSGQLFVYGRPGAVETVAGVAPGLSAVSRQRLRACLTRYLAFGWSGFVPVTCRNTLLTVPRNVAPWLWGWPNRFLERMDSVQTPVVLLGDYGGEGFSTPIDDPELLKALPPDYDGGIWTDRIDLLAPEFE
jgi:glycerophosphoryl diester phosphodiesterase